jgi:AraC family transcriptional regulator
MRTDWSVATIALEVGFLGPSHFARTFRAIRGVSPAVYRRMS